MSIVPSYKTIVAPTSDKLNRFFELQDLEEFIDECYAAGADARFRASIKGNQLEMVMEVDANGEVRQPKVHEQYLEF